MNKVVSKKSVLKNCISGNTEKKQKKKEKCACSPIIRKGKNLRKSAAKVKKVIRNAKLLNEWAENESSKPEIYEEPKILKSLQKVRSNDSVVYIGNYSGNQLHTVTPIIDLTQSSENLHDEMDLFQSKSLKTIYFPTRNFDRNIKLRKSMATTSLITLPVIKKQKLPRKLNSTTILSCADRNKLGILDIPPEYLNSPDVHTDYHTFFEKSKLTRTDHKMIDWILDIEDDILLSPSTSGYNSSLDTDASKEQINGTFDVVSKKKVITQRI